MLPGNVRIFAPPDDKATTLLQFSAAGLASASVLFVVGACGCKLVSSQKSESSGRLGVQGPPCPSFSRQQRYVFTLYALDAKVQLPAGASKQQLDEALTGHVLGQSHLVGWYARRPR
jgi:phosphatidylethanolamine-binding protein (PEBP) family uncharacterized protein